MYIYVFITAQKFEMLFCLIIENNNNNKADLLAMPNTEGKECSEKTLTNVHNEVTKISLTLRCPLCLSTLNRPCMLNCLHTFCHDCISRAVSDKQSCPVCNDKCTKRCVRQSDQLGEIVTSYQKALRTLGLAPMQYDSDVDMTQLEEEPHDEILLGEGAHVKLQASKLWQNNFEVNDPCLAEKQEQVVASNERLLQNTIIRKPPCSPPAQCLTGTVVQVASRTWSGISNSIYVENITDASMEENVVASNKRLLQNTISRKPSYSHPTPFPIGAVVQVASRTWSGVNKLGGVGRITAVQKEDIISYDVKYVLGGKEKNVDASFVSLVQDENQNQELTLNERPTKRNRRSLSSAIAKEKENISTFTKRGASSRPKRTPFAESRITVPHHASSMSPASNISQSDDSLDDPPALALIRYKLLLNRCLEKKSPIYIVMSSINEYYGQQLQILIDNMKRNKVIIKIQNQLSLQTCLCLTTPSIDHPTQSHFRTLKVMRATLFGIPILTPDWIIACLEKNRILLPDPKYLISSIPTRVESQMFHDKLHTSVFRHAAMHPSKIIFKKRDIFVFLCGTFEKGPKKNDVVRLLKDCNISILSSPKSTINALSSNFSKIILLCDESEESLTCPSLISSLKNYFNQGKKKVFIVSSFWLFDCISYGEELYDNVRSYEPKCRNAKTIWKKTFR